MPIGLRWGTVSAVLDRVEGLVRLEVDGDTCIAYPRVTGPVEEGDVVLVSHAAPSIAELDRGDLVVFADPRDGGRTIKRVVGLPGEAVVVLDGVLHVDGDPVAEPWVDPASVDGYYSRTFRVPAGRVFVLGDNRGSSLDSRDYGALAADDLRGRVLLEL